MVSAIRSCKFHRPSVLQETVIPMFGTQDDIFINGPTGSGKTLAYCVGMILKVNTHIFSPQVLCLAPNYEVAKQVETLLKNILTRFPQYVTVGLALRQEQGMQKFGEKKNTSIVCLF